VSSSERLNSAFCGLQNASGESSGSNMYEVRRPIFSGNYEVDC
jgi:hypothetical protein